MLQRIFLFLRFKKYFRMTPANFDHLLSMVKHDLTKKDTNMRPAIVPGLKLAITLHHLAEGSSYSSIAAHYRLGRSTVSEAINDTLKALWSALQPVYLKPPSGSEQWKEISRGYVPLLSFYIRSCLIAFVLNFENLSYCYLCILHRNLELTRIVAVACVKVN